MRRTAFVLITLSACASADSLPIDPFIDGNKGDCHPARLHEVDHHKLDMDEPSDLVIVDGSLYAVSDRHSKIYEVQPDGDVDEYLDIDGSDLDAIGFDAAARALLIADELKAKIWRLDGEGARVESIELDNADDGNSGIEGIVIG